MDHATLRKIAASVAVICRSQGGTVGLFFLLKALYLADRQMLIDYGVPITGDTYSSMPKGPILCGTYSLLKNKYFNDAFQAEWNSAISTNGNTISADPRTDTDCLSPAEEEILKEKISLIMQLVHNKVNVADWMHKNCPEWEEVAVGTSKPLRFTKVVEIARGATPEDAKAFKTCIDEAMLSRRISLLAKSPLLATA